jgi:predicted Zn-dependent protease
LLACRPEYRGQRLCGVGAGLAFEAACAKAIEIVFDLLTAKFTSVVPMATANLGRRYWLATGSAALVALALAACSFAPRQTFLPEEPKQEQRWAAPREHQRVLAAYGGAYEDPKIQAKIASVVERLVMASEQPATSYRVTILNSPTVNAFALPSGQLYVTRGLIGLANDSAELASVLSHEMAHVIARHAAIREEQARRTELISNVTDMLSDPQVGAMALARSKLAAASFSRAQEFEADGIGVGITTRAGYDPFGAARLLAAMGRNANLVAGARGGDGRSADFLSSHPATPDRVKNAENAARQHGAPGFGDRDKPAYLASLEGLIYGEDPVDGYVRGRRFLHPKLGFTFVAPEGFVLDNTAQAVLGLKDGATQALRLDIVRIPPEQSLIEYLNSGWIENIEDGSVEELMVNGFPAATASARGDQWAFRLYAVRFGSEVYRFIFAAKDRPPETDRSFRECVNTFRRLSLAEIQLVKPLRLHVVKVKGNDSVESLASRMALVDRQIDRFRVLNGLDANDRPKAGDLVKIIAE